MSEDPRDGVSRRDFGRLLGAAALGGMLPNAATGMHGSSGDDPPASPPASVEAPDELCDLDRSRARGADPPEAALGARGDGGAPGAHRAHEPEDQRHRHPRGRSRDGRREAGGRASGARRNARSTARAADGAQGSRRDRGHPHDEWLDAVARPRADDRRADREARARGRGHHAGQDEHPGVGGGLEHLQRRVRRDGQSLRPREDRRRKQRRGGGGAALRHGADRGRQRHRRLAAQPRGVHQRRRSASVAGTCAGRRRIMVAPLDTGPDGADRGGRRAPAQRDGGPVCARSARARRRRRELPRAARAELQGRARGVVQDDGRHPLRAGDHARRQRQPAGVRRSRLRRARRRARLRRRRRSVSDPAPHPVSREARRTRRASIPTRTRTRSSGRSPKRREAPARTWPARRRARRGSTPRWRDSSSGTTTSSRRSRRSSHST